MGHGGNGVGELQAADASVGKAKTRCLFFLLEPPRLLFKAFLLICNKLASISRMPRIAVRISVFERALAILMIIIIKNEGCS